MKDIMKDELGAPKIVDRSTFQAELDALRVREKAHTREGDAISAARRRLPMVEVEGATPLIGERGAVTLLGAFEGRRMLIAYYAWGEGARVRSSSWANGMACCKPTATKPTTAWVGRSWCTSVVGRTLGASLWMP